MEKIKKSYTIDFNKYGSYVSWQQMLLKEMYTEIKKINSILKSLVMVKGVWYDDNAALFVRWFNMMANTKLGYDKVYGTLQKYYIKSVGDTCKELKRLEPRSYATHPSVKKYGDAASIYDVLGTQYKAIKSENTFTSSQESVAKGAVTSATKTKVTQLLGQLRSQLNELEETATLYDKEDLQFSVGNKGLYIEGMGRGTAINVSGEVRKAENAFTKTFKAKLNEALKNSKLPTL